MNAEPGARLERRVLILAPIGKDAALLQDMLAREAVASNVCGDVDCIERELERGAAALLVAEEALPVDDTRLTAAVAGQPPWSDLPVLVLTRRGADSGAALRAVSTLGNVTLLERPVRVSALTSAVRSALRARDRQYQTRAHLAERELADRRKDEFLATLAHELRNPLAPIRNAVHVMRLSSSDQAAGRLLEVMDRQVAHMIRLVDDLMEVSRITRGSIQLRKAPVELAAVIAGAVETSRPLIDAARHSLTVVMPPEPLIVQADAMRLGQVFSNLLNNAVKYTDAEGRISVVAWREGANAVVMVSDTGIGIAAEALPRVFDMFVQADARDSRAQSGLGIGLTLVRSLVEMHGGRVTASSKGAGGGSEFTVHLPLASGAPVSPVPGDAAARRLGGTPRVLVVDDNQDAADSLGALLRMLGAEARVAYSGRAAVNAFDEFHPAAVFLDLGLPDMDGYQIAEQIRRRPGGREVVLAALTGWGQEGDRRRTRAAGFNQHLVKPAGVDALEGVLASLIK